MITAVHDLHFVQHFLHTLFPFVTFYTQIDQGQFHVFENGQLINQVKTLEYKSDIPFPEIGSFAFVEAGHFDAVKQEASAIWIVEQTQDIQ
jgi:hypothetical protein